MTTQHCDIKVKIVKVLRFYFYYSGGFNIRLHPPPPPEGGIPFARFGSLFEREREREREREP